MSQDENNAESIQCLCGAVRARVQAAAKRNIGACHCSLCRKWGGGPLLAMDCGTAVSFDGEENVAVYDSSDWAQRGFCRRCGTHLFYRLRDRGLYIMPAGLFGDDGAAFDHQVFIDEKPSYYDFANATENMTGAEIFAKYGATE